LRGPVDARRAVLAALAAREPWPLARAAVERARAAGVPRARALRLGLVTETLAAALHTSALAHRGDPLPTRLDRARRVLVADTLLTLCWELAAGLSDAAFPALAGELKRAAGGAGFLAGLASGRGEPPDPDAAASAFLDRTLPLLASRRRSRAPRSPS